MSFSPRSQVDKVFKKTPQGVAESNTLWMLLKGQSDEILLLVNTAIIGGMVLKFLKNWGLTKTKF